VKRALLAGVAVSTALVATAYALAFVPALSPSVAPVLLALGTGGILATVLGLGAQRNGRLGILWIPVVFVALVVGGGLVALVLMPAPPDGADVRLVAGLPPRAALLLYGVGFLPTLVVPVMYAVTFERLTLGEDDLERVRQAARERREAEEAAAAGEEGA